MKESGVPLLHDTPLQKTKLKVILDTEAMEAKPWYKLCPAQTSKLKQQATNESV